MSPRTITIVVILLLLLALLAGGWIWLKSWLSARHLDDLERHDRHRRLALARVELEALRSLGQRAAAGEFAVEDGLSFLLTEELLNRCLTQFEGLEGVSGKGHAYRITGAELQCLDGLALAVFDLEVETRYPGIQVQGRADTLLTLLPGDDGHLLGRFRLISVSPDYTIKGKKLPPFEFIRRMTGARLDRSARLKIPDLRIPLTLGGEIPFDSVDKQAADGAVTVAMPEGRLGYRVDLDDAGFYRGFIRASARAVTVSAPGDAKKQKKGPPSVGDWVKKVGPAGEADQPLEIDPLVDDPQAYAAEMARLEERLSVARNRLADQQLPPAPKQDAEVRCSREILDRLLRQLAGAFTEDVRITIENLENAWQKEQKLLGRTFDNRAHILHADGAVDIKDLRLHGISGNRLEVGVVIEGSATGRVKAEMFGIIATVPVDLQVRADRTLFLTMEDDGQGGFVVKPEPARIPLEVTAVVRAAGRNITLRPPLSLEAEKVIRPARVPLGFDTVITVPTKMRKREILTSKDLHITVTGGGAPATTKSGVLRATATLSITPLSP
jgi:hypothetical protein